MKYSRLFGKTVRSAKSDMTLPSHKLLYQAGFVRELSAGRYQFLPLGIRVKKKIIKIISEEMEKIGSQEISIPILQPMEFWQKSNRDKAWGDLLMKLKDARGGEFALSATGEGVITELVAGTSPSYKDLPIIVHQFIIKLRDEIRTRGGLLRAREFVMKDAYSYHTSEKDFMKTYQDFYDAYSKICDRLKLPYYPVVADSGALGGDYCHEFQIPCESGEDTIVKCDKCDYAANAEKAEFVKDKKNVDEELEELSEVKAPRGHSMQDGVKLHGLPLWQQIKCVVYKETGTDRYILAIIRGDYDVNEYKLRVVAGTVDLQMATSEQVKKDLGSAPGFISPVGIKDNLARGVKVAIVADDSVRTVKNAYGGSNKDKVDYLNMNIDRDFKADIEGDIAAPFNVAACKKCRGKLKLTRTIEFGHIFKYDHFYTQHHEGHFVDENGTKQLMWMGAYGIGIGRAMATVVEIHHDENGIIWPESVAPFSVHLIGLNLDDAKVKTKAEKVYDDLVKKSVEVLYDDREDVSAGVKFSDADLIGIPLRVVVSAKTGDKVEVKKRTEKSGKLVDLQRYTL